MHTPLKPQQAQDRLLPHVRHLLERIARKQAAPLQSLPHALARQAYAFGADVLEADVACEVCTRDFGLPRGDGSRMDARLYTPHNASGPALPALLFLHGGGFVLGSVQTHDALCRRLCAGSGCAVCSVDYRLAPEHRFPAAFEDAWDALQWLHGHAAGLGLDGTRLAVGGDSAGGTLAAACALYAARAGLALRLQLLFYPAMQAQPETASRRLYAEGFLLTEAQIQWMFASCVRDAADLADERFSPLCADVPDKLAALWLGLAQCDPLCDEAMLYGDKLRAAGVAVQLEMYRGVVHEFIKMGRVIPEGLQAVADASAALAAAMRDGSRRAGAGGL